MKNLGEILFIILLVLANSNFAVGDQLSWPEKTLKLNSDAPLNLDPLDTLNSVGIKSIGASDILEGFKFNFPFNVKNLNIDTNIPLSPLKGPSQGLPDSNDINLKQFLTPKDVSSDDLKSAVKAIVTLVIEIFLVVISITAQILKLILEFLR